MQSIKVYISEELTLGLIGFKFVKSVLIDMSTQVDRYGLRKRSFTIVYGAVYDHISP